MSLGDAAIGAYPPSRAPRWYVPSEWGSPILDCGWVRDRQIKYIPNACDVWLFINEYETTASPWLPNPDVNDWYVAWYRYAPDEGFLPHSLNVNNGNAETTDLTFTTLAGSYQRQTTNPYEGVGRWAFGIASGNDSYSYQDVPVTNDSIVHNSIDNNSASVRLTWAQLRTYSEQDQLELQVEFFDGSMVKIGARASSGLVVPPTIYELKEWVYAVPAGTRTIRLWVHTSPVPNLTGRLTGVLDNIEMELKLYEGMDWQIQQVWKAAGGFDSFGNKVPPTDYPRYRDGGVDPL